MIISAKWQAITTIPKNEIIPLLNASLTALVKYQDEINRLNVYPVPDGDTGTNMVLTVKSVRDEAVKAGDVSMGELARAITYGSLMGARGNSGVILSQIIRGMCEAVGDHEEITSDAIISALANGADVAYKAVKKPVEGTMLTVIKDMAEAAKLFSGKDVTIAKLLSYVIEEGKKSVERTPELLPILKESGVVDAGGYGLVIMLKGILSAQEGTRLENGIGGDFIDMTIVDEAIEYAYCTEFILKSGGVDMDELENRLNELGDSTLVVGTPELTKIHVHTNDPGKVIQIATGLGSITEVQINNIIEQSILRAQAIKEEGNKPDTKGIGIVAVANGKGIIEILNNLGVSKIVSGGQSMNPSTAELIEAVNAVLNQDIIVLPNNKNIILSAQQAINLTQKNVMVVPTRSIPEAFAALLAFDEEAPIDENVEAMIGQCEDVKTVEVTHAVRDGKNGEFKKGDYIGLFNGEVRAYGKDLIKTIMSLLEEVVNDNDEVATILAGDMVSQDELTELSNIITEKFPDIEVDSHAGHQPVYHFIIGIE